MPPPEVIRRRDLPHWDVDGSAYFVTSCLAGSIPARGLLDLHRYRAELRAKPRPAEVSASDWQRAQWKRELVRIDHWLDREPTVRHLEDSDLARIVMNSLLFFAGQRYDVLALVVMPSHFHWVFQPRDEWIATLTGDRTARERLLKSVKGYSARRCNERRGATGTFWQEESYDHWVRDVDELERIIHYVEDNPVKAGLAAAPEEWPFSSARLRHEQRLEFGVPLAATPEGP